MALLLFSKTRATPFSGSSGDALDSRRLEITKLPVPRPALVDALTKLVITCLPEPPSETRQAAQESHDFANDPSATLLSKQKGAERTHNKDQSQGLQ